MKYRCDNCGLEVPPQEANERCPQCGVPDQFFMAEYEVDNTLQNDVVSRAAPRWAWDVIDDLLSASTGRTDVAIAQSAMLIASDEDQPDALSREDVLERHPGLR